MTKLISRDPILRFKEGKKIVKALDGVKVIKSGLYGYTGRDGISYVTRQRANGSWEYWPVGGNSSHAKIMPENYTTPQGHSFYKRSSTNSSSNKILNKPKDTHYIGTRGNTDLFARSAKHAGVSNRDLVAALQRELGIKDDGIWGNETQKAWASRNGLQFTSPGIETGVKEYNAGTLNEDGSFTPNGSTYQDARKAVKSTISELNPQPATSYLTNTRGITLNRGNIRSNRNLYSNVDEYWNYLNSNEGRNSVDYGLWLNLYGNEVPIEDRRKIFDLVMNTFGIRGNLGRRDSGRLANVLNTLSGIGTNGSAIQKSFINSYDNARNASESNLLFANNYFKPQLTDWNTKMLEIKNRYGLRFKQGGLISRNPVKQFKANFRKEAL